MENEPKDIHELLQWVDGVLHDFAPEELLHLLDSIDVIKSGALDDSSTEAQRDEMVAQLEEEVSEWQKFLF